MAVKLPSNPVRSPESRAMDCMLTQHQFMREQDIFKPTEFTRNPIVNYREICVQCGQYYIVALPDGGVVTRQTRSNLFKGPEGRMPQYWHEAETIMQLAKRIAQLTGHNIQVKMTARKDRISALTNYDDFPLNTDMEELRQCQQFLKEYAHRTKGIHKCDFTTTRVPRW